MIVYTGSEIEKRALEDNTDWVKEISPEVGVVKKTWPIIIHGMRVADFPRDAFEENTKLLKKENDRLHPGLKIADVRWMSKVEGKKDYSSLIVEVASAEHANRIIIEGVIYRYDLKLVEVYDRTIRVTQYFKYQRYRGHISRACTGK